MFSFDDSKRLGEGGRKARLCEKGRRNEQWVSTHHHPELAVVDLPVPVLVHRPDHLVDLLVRHLARQVGQDKLELLRGDAALVVFTEHPERLLQVILNVCVLGFLVEHETELGKLKEARPVHIDLVDHVLHLQGDCCWNWLHFKMENAS